MAFLSGGIDPILTSRIVEKLGKNNVERYTYTFDTGDNTGDTGDTGDAGEEQHAKVANHFEFLIKYQY